jgi:hypothetical protein
MRRGLTLLPLSLITKSESGNIDYPPFNAAYRDYNDFKVASKDTTQAKTIDKHLFEFQGKNFGAIDIKISAQADRLAVSSIDSEVAIYNLLPERKLTHYKDLSEKFAG